MATDSDPIGQLSDRAFLFVELAIYVALLAWVAVMLSIASGWQYREDRLFPFIVGFALVGLILVKIVSLVSPTSIASLASVLPLDLSGKEEDPAQHAGIETDRTLTEQARSLAIMTLWIIVLAVALYYLGFVVIPLYLFLFSAHLLYGIKPTLGQSLKSSLVLTTIVTVFLYVLFNVVLEVPFWYGELGIEPPGFL